MISPTSLETNISDNDEKKIKGTIAATTKGASLREDPSAELRDNIQTDNEMSEY